MVSEIEGSCSDGDSMRKWVGVRNWESFESFDKGVRGHELMQASVGHKSVDSSSNNELKYYEKFWLDVC